MNDEIKNILSEIINSIKEDDEIELVESSKIKSIESNIEKLLNLIDHKNEMVLLKRVKEYEMVKEYLTLSRTLARRVERIKEYKKEIKKMLSKFDLENSDIPDFSYEETEEEIVKKVGDFKTFKKKVSMVRKKLRANGYYVPNKYSIGVIDVYNNLAGSMTRIKGIDLLYDTLLNVIEKESTDETIYKIIVGIGDTYYSSEGFVVWITSNENTIRLKSYIENIKDGPALS